MEFYWVRCLIFVGWVEVRNPTLQLELNPIYPNCLLFDVPLLKQARMAVLNNIGGGKSHRAGVNTIGRESIPPLRKRLGIHLMAAGINRLYRSLLVRGNFVSSGGVYPRQSPVYTRRSPLQSRPEKGRISNRSHNFHMGHGPK